MNQQHLACRHIYSTVHTAALMPLLREVRNTMLMGRGEEGRKEGKGRGGASWTPSHSKPPLINLSIQINRVEPNPFRTRPPCQSIGSIGIYTRGSGSGSACKNSSKIIFQISRMNFFFFFFLKHPFFVRYIEGGKVNLPAASFCVYSGFSTM